MKVILRENIENLGKKGDIVKVASGYGRNYLIPKKMALQVKPSNRKMIEMEQTALQKGLEIEMESYQTLIQQLNEVKLSFYRKAGEKDAIFGSVNASDIKEALEVMNFEIEKKRILLGEPIKKLGNYTVFIKIFHNEQAEIKIQVMKEQEQGTLETSTEEAAAPSAEEPEPELEKASEAAASTDVDEETVLPEKEIASETSEEQQEVPQENKDSK